MEIIKRFPQRKFILIGDSGVQDREVYGDLLRAHPAQFLGLALRAPETLPAFYEVLLHSVSDWIFLSTINVLTIY